MSITRLLAISHPEACLDMEVWERTVALDREVDARLRRREEERISAKIGQPGAT